MIYCEGPSGSLTMRREVHCALSFSLDTTPRTLLKFSSENPGKNVFHFEREVF